MGQFRFSLMMILVGLSCSSTLWAAYATDCDSDENEHLLQDNHHKDDDLDNKKYAGGHGNCNCIALHNLGNSDDKKGIDLRVMSNNNSDNSSAQVNVNDEDEYSDKDREVTVNLVRMIGHGAEIGEDISAEQLRKIAKMKLSFTEITEKNYSKAYNLVKAAFKKKGMVVANNSKNMKYPIHFFVLALGSTTSQRRCFVNTKKNEYDIMKSKYYNILHLCDIGLYDTDIETSSHRLNVIDVFGEDGENIYLAKLLEKKRNEYVQSIDTDLQAQGLPKDIVPIVLIYMGQNNPLEVKKNYCGCSEYSCLLTRATCQLWKKEYKKQFKSYEKCLFPERKACYLLWPFYVPCVLSGITNVVCETTCPRWCSIPYSTLYYTVSLVFGCSILGGFVLSPILLRTLSD